MNRNILLKITGDSDTYKLDLQSFCFVFVILSVYIYAISTNNFESISGKTLVEINCPNYEKLHEYNNPNKQVCPIALGQTTLYFKIPPVNPTNENKLKILLFLRKSPLHPAKSPENESILQTRLEYEFMNISYTL